MQKTKIGYLTHTWNPIAMRCTPVSDGCRNCWHLRMAARLKEITEHLDEKVAYSGGTPWLRKKELDAPLRLRKPARIGVQFMGDLFHESVDGQFIIDVFLIAERCKQHTFMFLTKRPERMLAIFSYMYNRERLVKEKRPIPDNIWLGVSVEDQKTADERIPLLLQTPAAVRFVSYEPALGPILFASQWMDKGRYGQYGVSVIDWIVMGGESGPGARPMHPEWVRSVRDQCQAAEVPLYFKQWGEYTPHPNTPIAKWPTRKPNIKNIPVGHTFDDGQVMFKVGTKRAGRLLDGREWDEVPK